MKTYHQTGLTRQMKIGATVLALAMMSTGVGCGDDFEELETPETCSQELQLCEANVFLTVEEFEFLRQQDDVIVFDSRGDEGDFEGGHVPGAYFAHWGLLRDDDGILYEDDEILEGHLVDLGVDQDSTILIYGEGDGSGGDSVAGNFYWTLEYLGHDDVYLLDGGMSSWLDAEVSAMDTGAVEPEPGSFTVERREEMVAPFEEIHEAIESGDRLLLDTRTYDEWTGEDTRNNDVGGHIPDAVHYHWEDLLDENAELRSEEDLLAELEGLGIEPGSDIIAYCQSGVRSGFFYAVLQELGFPQPQNYDGSWHEWSRQAASEDIAVPEE